MQAPPPGARFLGFNLTGDLGPFTIYTSKRRGTVWFPKSPPQKPPSDAQRHWRARFRNAMLAWNHLPQRTRDAWNTACRRAHLYLSGINLWLWWQLKRDSASLSTIERLSGTQLRP